MRLRAPFLTYSDISQKSVAFLNEFHPSTEIPIPIEDIIELKIGLNIFPYPRLYKDHGLNGYLSYDLTTIRSVNRKLTTCDNRKLTTLKKV